MTTSGIYQIRRKGTRHCYIGSSVNLQSRKRVHFHYLRQGKHHSQYLQRAYDKYGEDVFEWTVIEEVLDPNMLIQREQYWIDKKNPCYNMNGTAASNLGLHHSEETKTRLREYNLLPEVVAKKKAELTGHAVAPDTIAKIKEARSAQATTPAMLECLGQRWKATGERKGTRKGATNTAEHNRKIAEKATGRKPTPETREKMRAAKLGKKQSQEFIDKRISASWANKTEEEKQMIIAKRKATMDARRAM